VSGVVRDSTRSAPLKGGRGLLSGTTDAEGRFLIHDVPEELSETHLCVPSIGHIVAGAYSGQARGKRSAVVAGLVLDQGTGQPIPGAAVRFTRHVVSAPRGRLTGDNEALDVTMNDGGRRAWRWPEPARHRAPHPRAGRSRRHHAEGWPRAQANSVSDTETLRARTGVASGTSSLATPGQGLLLTTKPGPGAMHQRHDPAPRSSPANSFEKVASE